MRRAGFQPLGASGVGNGRETTSFAWGSLCGYSGDMNTAVALLIATAARLAGLNLLLAGLLLRPARTK
jgi:hypothetical protein